MATVKAAGAEARHDDVPGVQLSGHDETGTQSLPLPEPVLGKDFLDRNFTNVNDLRRALVPYRMEILFNKPITSLLPPSLLMQMRTNTDATSVMDKLVLQVTDRHQVPLQKALYEFITGQPGLRICLLSGRSSQTVPFKPVLPPPSPCYGRDEQAKKLIEAFKTTERSTISALLHGPSGMGKTNLALHVVAQREIATRYRIYWVDCGLLEGEGTTNFRSTILTKLLHKLATKIPQSDKISTLLNSNTRSTDLLPFLDRLDEGKTLLCLDNLEAAQEEQKSLWEDLLPALLQRTSLLVTQWSETPPCISLQWTCRERLEPLTADDSLKVLSMYAQKSYEGDEGVKDLLKGIEGYPLALQILGGRAAGGASYEELKHYWDEQLRGFAKDDKSHQSKIGDIIRRVLQSRVMQDNPLALRLLDAVCRLPRSIPCAPKDLGPIEMRGLSRSLATFICNDKQKTWDLFHALRQTGLTTAPESNRDLLVIIGPIRAHLSEISSSSAESAQTAEMVTNWLAELGEKIAMIADYTQLEVLSPSQQAIEEDPDYLEKVRICLDARAELEERVGNLDGAKRVKALKAGWEAEAIRVTEDWLEVASAYERCADLWQSATRAAENHNVLRHKALSADARALAYEDMGNYIEANKRRRFAIAFWEQDGSYREADWQRARIRENEAQNASDDFEEVRLFAEVVDLWGELGESDLQEAALAQLASRLQFVAERFLKEDDNVAEAIDYLHQAAEAWQRIERESLATACRAQALGWQAKLKEDIGDLNGALKEYDEEARLWEIVDRKYSLRRSRASGLNCRAMQTTKPEEALNFVRESRRLFEKLEERNNARRDRLLQAGFEAEIAGRWTQAVRNYREAAKMESGFDLPGRQPHFIKTYSDRAAACERRCALFEDATKAKSDAQWKAAAQHYRDAAASFNSAYPDPTQRPHFVEAYYDLADAYDSKARDLRAFMDETSKLVLSPRTAVAAAIQLLASVVAKGYELLSFVPKKASS